ncbi:MAG TPA: (2Fe-2S) ferredoxin domain-containing protein [Bdellovibrionota bacterium]|nr:(2Fe-2S) ferredoxin domain-containing protein [Bdellovibrionota bacterium]
MTVDVKKLRSHVFVCTNERPPGSPRGCCKERGSEALVKLFKDELSRRGIKGEIRAQKSGCLDTCEFGPSVVVYPEGTWYGRVTPADVAEIVESHLVGGKPVDRLRIPGK